MKLQLLCHFQRKMLVKLYCVIWKRNEKWELFSNEIWLTEAEALDYGKRNKFKKNIEWKVADAAEWF